MERKDGIRNREYGEKAEQAACDWLTARGYDIRERNWSPRRGHKEIDIIVQQGNVIAFVEVKARTSDFMDPVEAVTSQKISRIVRAANSYLLLLPEEVGDAVEARFDIMAISGDDPDWQIEHIEDAFFAPLSSC